MDAAVQALAKANKVVIFSGAGVSAESGIDVFRGGSGFWSGILGTCALAYFGTPFGWNLTPGIAWTQYVQRFYNPIEQAQPNAAHVALATLEKQAFPHLRVITQNVDGLHQQAGNTKVYELHGTVRRHKCIANGHEYKNFTSSKLPEQSPKCDKCDSTLRPDCVLFTESLPGFDWSNAEKAIGNLKAGDVMIIVGTSAKVYPAASLPEYASLSGATLIEVNMERTSYSDLQNCIFVQGKAGIVLPELVNKAIAIRQPNTTTTTTTI